MVAVGTGNGDFFLARLLSKPMTKPNAWTPQGYVLTVKANKWHCRMRWIEKTDKEGESGIPLEEGKVDCCLLESIILLEPMKLDLKIVVLERTVTTQNRAKGEVWKQKAFKREYLQLAEDNRESISASCLAK